MQILLFDNKLTISWMMFIVTKNKNTVNSILLWMMFAVTKNKI